ncbi:MAG: hypothetical protein ACFFAU_10975 [Candidatus Hodarchaeota archaeon]
MNDSKSLSVEKGVERLLNKMDKEWEEKILDVLLRIAFRPNWNYTGTILKRRDTATRLWKEVEGYLEVKQQIQPRELLRLKREIEKTFLEEIKLDLVTLYPLPGPPARPGSEDCYNRWYNFQQEVLAGMHSSIDKYVKNSIEKLSDEEKDIIRSVLRCLPVPDHGIVYMQDYPQLCQFMEEIEEDYKQTYGGPLNIQLLSKAIIRAGLGDWTTDNQLCIFTREITYPPKFIVEHVDIDEFLSLEGKTVTPVSEEMSGITIESPEFSGKEDETALLEFTIRNHESAEKTVSIGISTGFRDSDKTTGNYMIPPLSEKKVGPFIVGTPHFTKKSEPIRIELRDDKNLVIYEQLIKVNVQRSMKKLLFNVLFSRFRLRY